MAARMPSNTGLADSPHLPRRKSMVYVEIPPSPLHGSFIAPADSPSLVFKRKRVENMNIPLTDNILKTNSTSNNIDSPSKIRKVADVADCQLTATADKPKVRSLVTPESLALQYPNGYFYCHQCSQRRDISDLLRCTVKHPICCKTKYCAPCVKRRYGQDIHVLKVVGPLSGKYDELQHEAEVGYRWQCFKCSGACNCSYCRKASGLAPMGRTLKFPFEAEKREANRAQHPLQKEVDSSIAAGNVVKRHGTGIEPAVQTVVQKKPRAPRKVRVVPAPKWVKVPTSLTYDQVNNRFFIREFMLRFSPLMTIAQKYLDELDEFETFSEAAAKKIILCLLDLIAADAETELKNMIREAHKKISAVGSTPASMWEHLSSLRGLLPSTSELQILEPNYSVTPPDEKIGTTEMIAQASQLVPVIVGLVNTAIQGPSVREEITNGVKDLKAQNRDYFAAVRKEEARREAEKEETDALEASGKDRPDWDIAKWAEMVKAQRVTHRTILHNLEQEHFLNMQLYAPRFQTLGKDSDSREYYLSTPFASKKAPNAEDRGDLNRWSWFLAVWGKGGNTDNEDGEHWWGFSDPAEIKKLAKWLEDRDRHNDMGAKNIAPGSSVNDAILIDGKEENGSTAAAGAGMKKLVKDLNAYADFLSWRYTSSNGHDGDSVKVSASNLKPVAPNQFYKKD